MENPRERPKQILAGNSARLIDRRGKIDQLLPIVQQAVQGGIVLRDQVEVVVHT